MVPSGSLNPPDEFRKSGKREVILNSNMFRAIGFCIALLAISIILDDAFDAFEAATVATFNTVETAAIVSEQQIVKQTE